MSKKNQPKTERGQETLDRLLQEAAQLFSEKGYHRTTIKDITSAAGVGVGTYYLYFEDKYSIYKTLLLQFSHVIRRNIAIRIQGAGNRKEAEKLGIVAFLEATKENPSMYHIIWESLYIDKHLFYDYYTNFAKSYIKQIEYAQSEGQMRPYDPEVVAYMLMGISNFIGLRYALFEEAQDFGKIADEVVRVLDEGLFTKNSEMKPRE